MSIQARSRYVVFKHGSCPYYCGVIVAAKLLQKADRNFIWKHFMPHPNHRHVFTNMSMLYGGLLEPC
jgi:hypothetical protein